jgi:hypothetical protein
MPFPILPSNSATGYFLTKSLRFRNSASAYLNRTPASTTNQTTWTVSFWTKLAVQNTSRNCAFGAGQTDVNIRAFGFYPNWQGYSLDNTMVFGGGLGTNCSLATTARFRDPSAWYHIVVAVDTTQATNTNRIKLYVNGVQYFWGSNASGGSAIYPAQNDQFYWNTTSQANYIGTMWDGGTTSFFNGYITEFNSIDGQQLTPSSFGSTNSKTGVWQPAKYTGTYGTNGFYLPFTNTTSTTTLGYDFSGNSNNWTTNNLSLTAGTTYDSMNDVPTLTSATTANYAVMNPLSQSSYITLSGGNLNTAGNTTSDTGVAGSTFGLVTGKWYAEYTVNSTNSNRPGIGIIANPTGNFRNGDLDFSNAGSFEYYPNGALDVAGSRLGTFSTFTTGDIIGIAIDCDNGAAYVSKNNTWQNSGVPTSGASKTGAVVTWTPTSTYTQYVAVAQYNTSSASTNFGQRAFSYTPPTNFNSVNTYNLPTSTIVKGNTVMDAQLYTGNGSSQTLTTTSGFKPDLVWIKQRSAATGNDLTDTVRGATITLQSQDTAGDETRVNDLTAFTSTGFSVGSGGNVNTNAGTYVAWEWQAGQGSTSSNTSGSITSTTSVNATAGFSIVTYTGTGSNATVGHGLGVAPQMIIVKERSTNRDWPVWQSSLTGGQALFLNSTIATQSDTTIWNNTLPTSSVFSVATSTYTNQSTGTYVAYCWSQIAGFSKFGSYTGNGSTDGPFVYLGFRPKFILIKNSNSSVQGWTIQDTSRSTYNVVDNYLLAQASSAEQSIYAQMDYLSNGFKLKTNDALVNGSGNTMIYMAFAENPFKNALAR